MSQPYLFDDLADVSPLKGIALTQVNSELIRPSIRAAVLGALARGHAITQPERSQRGHRGVVLTEVILTDSVTNTRAAQARRLWRVWERLDRFSEAREVLGDDVLAQLTADGYQACADLAVACRLADLHDEYATERSDQLRDGAESTALRLEAVTEYVSTVHARQGVFHRHLSATELKTLRSGIAPFLD